MVSGDGEGGVVAKEADDVKVRQPRLDHHDVSALHLVRVSLPQRLPVVGRVLPHMKNNSVIQTLTPKPIMSAFCLLQHLPEDAWVLLSPEHTTVGPDALGSPVP